MDLTQPVWIIASVSLAGLAHAAAAARGGEGRVAVQALVETSCSVAVDTSGSEAARQENAVQVTCSDQSGYQLSMSDENVGAAVQKTAKQTADRPARRFYTVTY